MRRCGYWISEKKKQKMKFDDVIQKCRFVTISHFHELCVLCDSVPTRGGQAILPCALLKPPPPSPPSGRKRLGEVASVCTPRLKMVGLLYSPLHAECQFANQWEGLFVLLGIYTHEERMTCNTPLGQGEPLTWIQCSIRTQDEGCRCFALFLFNRGCNSFPAFPALTSVLVWNACKLQKTFSVEGKETTKVMEKQKRKWKKKKKEKKDICGEEVKQIPSWTENVVLDSECRGNGARNKKLFCATQSENAITFKLRSTEQGSRKGMFPKVHCSIKLPQQINLFFVNLVAWSEQWRTILGNTESSIAEQKYGTLKFNSKPCIFWNKTSSQNSRQLAFWYFCWHQISLRARMVVK